MVNEVPAQVTLAAKYAAKIVGIREGEGGLSRGRRVPLLYLKGRGSLELEGERGRP